ncbi:hypothetical protein SRHO_G00100730 [Serrasalmus rhombeus]
MRVNCERGNRARRKEQETLHVSQTEGRIAVLHCGRLTNGKVTWSRDTNGQRVDILTTHNGQTTKHIADPDRRYDSQADLVLTIFRVSQSDAGRYDCSGATVELSVTEETLHQTEKEGNTVALKCGRLTKGPVIWSRDTNGQRVDILTTHNGQTTKHITDPDRRYGSRKDPVLIIYGVSQSDAGRYDCSGATVELSVTSGTAERTTTTTTEASTTEGSSERPFQDLWKVLTTVTVSCLVALVLVLLSWICFYKRKGYAVKHNQEHVYDSIDDTMPTAQPVSDQQRTEEPIYYLASHPGAQTTDTTRYKIKHTQADKHFSDLISPTYLFRPLR